MSVVVRKIAFGIVCLVSAGVVYGGFLFFKKPPDTRNEEADMEISAEALAREFSSDEALATKKFSGKILIVFGTVTELTTDRPDIAVSLAGGDPITGVTCSFYPDELMKVKMLKPDCVVRVKGKCTG